MRDLYGGDPKEGVTALGIFARKSALFWKVKDGFSGLLRNPPMCSYLPPNLNACFPIWRATFWSKLYVLPSMSQISALPAPKPDEPETEIRGRVRPQKVFSGTPLGSFRRRKKSRRFMSLTL